MRVLVLNGAGGGGIAALLERGRGGIDLVRQAEQPGRGGAERLAAAVRDLLCSACWDACSIGLIAAAVGPGSFTGLRASLSLAQGLALGLGVPLHGATLPEALRRTVGERAGKPLWCVCVARSDRIFLESDASDAMRGCMLEALPEPPGPVLLAGDASALVAARIARASPSGIEKPTAAAIAAIALDRLEGVLPPIAVLPLYVDPPQARPAVSLRPPPSCPPQQ